VSRPAAPTALGHAVCGDIANGSSGSVKVLQVESWQYDRTHEFTTQQAEEILYRVVADLCSQHLSQVEDRWQDGE
jgi:hypothetical protein